MSEQFISTALRFYLTEPQPCPYLPDRFEQKVFTPLNGAHAAEINDELSANGFRRSQNVAYRPQCPTCAACVATRIRAADFSAGRRDRRILKGNAMLRRRVQPAAPTEAQYDLFRAYVGERHAGGGMSDMDALDYASMVEDSTVRTQIIEYWGDDENGEDVLRAACITDVLIDGLSMVYSFFDPALARQSVGRFMVLDHIEMVRTLELSHLYLGYWVEGCRKMTYKADFPAAEFLLGGRWTPAAPVLERRAAAMSRVEG